MDERVKKVVAHETAQFKAISRDAVNSRAYIYPIKVRASNAQEAKSSNS
jgi:hypothetical protein